VIASGTGGPREIIEDGKSGLLAPGSRPEDVADAVQRLLDDAGLRERLAAGAVERFRSRFAAERMTAELQGAIAELCAA
jgi:D-inositol-3-phosphate glycosyltransferase